MAERTIFDFLLEALIGIALYALLIYTVVYFVMKPIKRHWPNGRYRRFVWIVPLVLGLIIAVVTRYNAYEELLPSNVGGGYVIGMIFTGLSIGGLSTVIHDALTRNQIDFGELLGDLVVGKLPQQGEGDAVKGDGDQ